MVHEHRRFVDDSEVKWGTPQWEEEIKKRKQRPIVSMPSFPETLRAG